MPNSSLCEVLLPSGRDCPGHVPPDAPINVCWSHLEIAAKFVADSIGTQSGLDAKKVPAPCPACNLLGLWWPGASFDVICRQCNARFPASLITGAIKERMDQLAAAATQADAPKPSVVYFIRFGDRIKIGTTTNKAKRLQSLPHEEVLGVIPGDRSAEQALHLRFRHLRITGEWFEDVPELREFIVQVVKNAALGETG